MKTVLIALMIGFAAPLNAALAQQATLVQQTLNCADFKYAGNGAWTTIHTVTLNGIQLGPDITLSPGVQMGGIDLAAAVNAQCSHP